MEFFFGNDKFDSIDFSIIKKKVPAGDLLVPELGFGVERKTVEDFVGSIRDGRVFKQIYKMIHSFEYPYLFVSGNLLELYSEPEIKSILTSCADFQARYNIRIMFFPNDYYLIHYYYLS